MNDKIWENVKNIVDECMVREKLLKELLEEREEEIKDLRSGIKELEKELSNYEN